MTEFSSEKTGMLGLSGGERISTVFLADIILKKVIIISRDHTTHRMRYSTL